MITECFYIQWLYNLKCKDVRESLCWCWHRMLLMLHPLNKWVTETKGNHPSWAEEVRGHQLHSELSWLASGFQCPQVLPCVIRVHKVTTHQVALWLDLTNKCILTEGMVLVCAKQHGLKSCVFLPSIRPSIHQGSMNSGNYGNWASLSRQIPAHLLVMFINRHPARHRHSSQISDSLEKMTTAPHTSKRGGPPCNFSHLLITSFSPL